jgi:glutamate carboxypeptidase
MDALLDWVRAREREMVALLKALVETETPSGEAAAISRFAGVLGDALSGLGRVKKIDGGAWGPHLLCDFKLPGRPQQGRLLALGHSDTVHPFGSLAAMPFRQAEGRLWGPGVFDMKAGLVFLVFAARALRELGIPVRRKLALLVNSDEEVGSPSSRPVTEAQARQSAAVLVLEPATGLEGKLKTARKGVGDYVITVRGRAAHAGLDFERGASAVLELARQIERVAGFTDLARGITVNAGVIAGGTRTNVVPAEARAEIDVRVVRLRDAAALDRKFRGLRPFDKRCTVEVTGGLNRPPMERSAAGARLFRLAQLAAGELGIEIEESLSGGGSDGNFTAALGVATLDGLGAVGEGAHTPGECILTDRMAERTALLAKLIAGL